MLKINLTKQTLQHYQDKVLLTQYAISSAKNGAGEIEGSNCTPRGLHKISEKIGAGLAINSVLIAREPTGEIYHTSLAKKHPDRDWILSRILWLDGCKDLNKNSKQRFIYIHGTPNTQPMGVPTSHGCIRMRNQDVIALFEQVSIEELVIIEA